MITATSSTAGAGNSHRAWWCALALSSIEEVLEVLLRLREHLGGGRPLDSFLDGDADDVAVLGDADDLRQSLAADLERGLVGLIPVGGHLRLGLHLRAVPRRASPHADPGHELTDHVLLARGPLSEEVRGLLVAALGRNGHPGDVDRRDAAARPRWEHRVADLADHLRLRGVLELAREIHAVHVDHHLALHERRGALVPVEVAHAP